MKALVGSYSACCPGSLTVEGNACQLFPLLGFRVMMNPTISITNTQTYFPNSPSHLNKLGKTGRDLDDNDILEQQAKKMSDSLCHYVSS
jgi:hypothetical protein